MFTFKNYSKGVNFTVEKLIVASNNKGKIKEIKSILSSRYEIISMSEAGYKGEIEENGASFYENALIKARAVAEALSCDALADDSGLCVDSLNGAPGVFSARFSGVHGDDKANRIKLLEMLKGKENRNAEFKSSVVLCKKNGEIFVGYGETKGCILEKETGENGFGYDSLFYSYDLNKSFGEASNEEKNSVSHRYRALCDLLSKL